MKHFRLALFSLILAVLTAMPLYAATNYDFKELTPEIKKALQNRQTRYAKVQELKREGLIGENNRGYVTDLKKSSASMSLAEAENRDRRTIYENLVSQNNLGANGLLEVQRAFAEVQRDKAFTGDMIQSSSGNWEKKS